MPRILRGGIVCAPNDNRLGVGGTRIKAYDPAAVFAGITTDVQVCRNNGGVVGEDQRGGTAVFGAHIQGTAAQIEDGFS